MIFPVVNHIGVFTAPFLRRRRPLPPANKAMPRSQFQRRSHPLLSTNNAWTWKFLPGLVIGFLVKCWIDKESPIQVGIGHKIETQS